MRGHTTRFAVAASILAAGAVVPVASAQAEAMHPAHATITEAHCADLSGLGGVLGLGALGSVPTVRTEVTPTASDAPLPYEILVDGVRKGGGTVTGGRAITTVDVPRGKPAHVVVLSNGVVLAERTVTASC